LITVLRRIHMMTFAILHVARWWLAVAAAGGQWATLSI